MSSSVTLRDAAPGDEDFLFSLHRATMRDYVIATWGAWDETDQRRRYAAGFADPAAVRVIVCDGRDVGSLVVKYRGADIYVARIEVLPRFQGRGIGSGILRDLLSRAAATGGQVELHVLRSNQRAKRLYERLGFHTRGEDAERYLMRSA